MKKIIITLLIFFSMATVQANPTEPTDTYSLICTTIMNHGVDQITAAAYANKIIAASLEHDADPLLVTAQISSESNFNAAAESEVGAIGLGQLMPATAADLGVNPYDPLQNIDGTALYVHYMVTDCTQRFGPENGIPYGVAAYNAGLQAVRDYFGIPPFQETQGYVAKVMMKYAKLLSGQPLTGDEAGSSAWATFIAFKIDLDFARDLRDIITRFAQVSTASIKIIQDDVKWLFFSLLCISLAYEAMMKLFDEEPEYIEWLFKCVVKYGFILYLIIHWGDIVANFVKDYFVYMGAKSIGTDPATAGELLSNPTDIVQKGAYILGPAFTYLQKFYSFNLLIPGNLENAIGALLVSTAIFLCYVIIGIEIALAYVEFYVIASLSVVTLGWAGFLQTQFVARGGIAALLAAGMKLMIFSFFSVLLSNLIKDLSVTQYELLAYLKILLVSLLFVVMSKRLSISAKRMFLGGN